MRERNARPYRSSRGILGLAVVLAALAATPAHADEYLVASDGAGSHYLGTSVAIDGNLAVVGAYRATAGGQANAGAAYVFERAGSGTWTQKAKLIASDPGFDDQFGVSVAIDGDTIVVGAPRWDAPEAQGSIDNDQGAAYVFPSACTGTCMQAARLRASGNHEANSWDVFGASVAINSAWIVVGAPDPGGQVYVFTRGGAATNGERTETRKISSTMGTQVYMGLDVDIAGDTIVAGAPGYAPPGELQQGAVLTYDAATGAETARMTASDGAQDAGLGSDVAVDGGTIAATAPGADDDAGAIYTFATTAPELNREETAKLTASDRGPDDDLSSVAVDGSWIVGGAPGWDRPGCSGFNCDNGAVYVFAAAGDDRTEFARRAGPTDQGIVAEAVDLQGTTALVGEPSEHVNHSFQGRGVLIAGIDVPRRTLTVQTTGAGYVLSTPSGIDCGDGGTRCAATYDGGTQVTLRAYTAPDPFAGWGGACAGFGTARDCVLTMNADHAVTATFGSGGGGGGGGGTTTPPVVGGTAPLDPGATAACEAAEAKLEKAKKKLKKAKESGNDAKVKKAKKKLKEAKDAVKTACSA